MQTTKNDGLKNIVKIRPSWDEYFLGMLPAVSARASCDRGRSSAILVRNNRILSTGFVGAPTGLPDCYEAGHLLINRLDTNIDGTIISDSIHCTRTFHAEMNAILSCAKEGVSTIGATMFCTMVPCITCGMAIIQASIIRVVALNRYQKDQTTRDMFLKTGIELVVISENELEYAYK